jgi:ribose transport system permease protein
MKRLRQLALRYGTSMALLLMCAALSLLTLRDQYPTGADAARQLARRLQDELVAGDHVMIVTQSSNEDARFAEVLRQTLQEHGLTVTSVSGSPRDARTVLQSIADRGASLDAIAATYATANWLVFRDLANDFPALGGVPLHQPRPYTWPTFLRTDNLLNVANQIAVIAIIAVGMTFVIIAGGIDLSVGSLIAFSSVIAGVLIRDYGGGSSAGTAAMILASLAAVTACGLVGAFSGAMVIGWGIPPFIVTLAMMMVASGAAFLLADGNSIPELPPHYTWLGRGADLLAIPNAVVLMGVMYALAHLLLTSTVLGRHIYAVGDNPHAAWLSGIAVRRVVLFTYVASACLAGVGGIVVASNYQSGDPRYGIMYELYVIAAVVVGGTSLSGGRGTVFGTLIGAFIIGVINNGMNLLQVNPYAQKVILGVVILAAVMLDRLQADRSPAGQGA